MNNYNLLKKDVKIYIKEVFNNWIKIPLIILLVSFPFTLYFMLIGYLVDKEALLYGYCLLTIVILMLSVIILRYYRVKKLINKYFNDYEEINLSLDNSEKYTIYNITTNEKIIFIKSEVKGKFKNKNSIVLFLNNNKILLLPKNNEIENIFFNTNSK